LERVNAQRPELARLDEGEKRHGAI
jgi:hypothetical protein